MAEKNGNRQAAREGQVGIQALNQCLDRLQRFVGPQLCRSRNVHRRRQPSVPRADLCFQLGQTIDAALGHQAARVRSVGALDRRLQKTGNALELLSS